MVADVRIDDDTASRLRRDNLVMAVLHAVQGIAVVVLVLAGRPYDTFLTTRLDLLFEIFHDEEGALASFGSDHMTAGIP